MRSPGEWVLGTLVLETLGGRATPTGEPWLMSFQPMNHLFRRKGLVLAIGLEASMAVAPSGPGGGRGERLQRPHCGSGLSMWLSRAWPVLLPPPEAPRDRVPALEGGVPASLSGYRVLAVLRDACALG